MLKKIKLKNFQLHEDLELEFVPGLNIITGASHSGKSSVFRALRYLFRNKPSIGSNCFLRHDQDLFSVEAIVDGKSIKREKDRLGRVNKYTVDGNEYPTVGTTVPEEIDEWTGGSIVEIGNDEYDLSFLSQTENSFLVFENDGTKAKAIGKLSGVDVLDNGVKKANSEALAEAKKLGDLKAKVKEFEIKLNYLEPFEEQKEKFESIEKKYLKLKALEGKVTGLKKLKVDYQNSFARSVKNPGDAIEKTEKLNDLISLYGQSSKYLYQISRIKSVLESVKRTLSKKVPLAIGIKIDLLDIKIKEFPPIVDKYRRVIALVEKAKKSVKHKKFLILLRENASSIKKIKDIENLLGKSKVNLDKFRTLYEKKSQYTKYQAFFDEKEKEQNKVQEEIESTKIKINKDLEQIDFCSKCNQPLMNLNIKKILEV